MIKQGRKLFSVSDASVRAGGTFVSFKNIDPDILSVSIDSRTVSKGDLFIALIGEFTDGHKFISMAVEAGASGVMISEIFYTDHRGVLSEYGVCFIVVENTLLGFQNLAASWVKNFDKLIKIAITGSNGKSTTKEMIGAILTEDGSTVTNKGNLNSETGLPLSVLSIDPDHKYGVFEMGINNPGEMKALVSVFSPDYALITNIGTAHIGLLGNQRAIAVEKSEIFSLFSEKNTGFINEDDTWASFLKERCPGNTILYGSKSTTGVDRVTNLGLRGWEIIFKGLKIRLGFIGQHNLTNAIASISLASTLGVGPDKIKRGLEKLNPLKGRSRIIEGKYTIIEDSYNANVESMTGILNFISELGWPGRLVLILGSMKELGAYSAEMHKTVGMRALALEPDLLFFYGEEMKVVYNLLLHEQYSGRLIYASDFSELESAVLNSLEKGDLILLKGSLSMNLNKLADIISKSMEYVDV
jgi:UDP-N-acetylmuramoyl-tripeptide--D-alanyl-D-alanine ligase